ncbi:anillin-like isoform X2 [Vespula squamosa]|uniref:Anillin-like isoform X2 n=1 Tax=Vespula squamosa TaxID=30214 RepID=A0ABD2BF84_VESSQ
MVLTNSTDNAEESFMRRFICRASVKKQESFELPAIQPRRKMNILYAISIYRFKGFRHKCTKLSSTALNCLNKEILIKSENCAKDIPIPSKFLENKIFLDECKRDIMTKKCQNWDIKIETTLYDGDLPLYDIFIPQLIGIEKGPLPGEKTNVDLVKEKAEIACKDNKNDEKYLKTDKNLNEATETNETIKKETPYTRLNEAIKDLKEHMELLECKTNPIDPSKVSLDLRTSSNVRDEELTDYVPAEYKASEDTSNEIVSQNVKRIEENLDEGCPIDLAMSQYQATPVSRNNIFNKNKKKIEKPKRMRPNLESTRKSSPVDPTKRNISPCSIQSTISTITPIVPSKFVTEEKNDDKYSCESSEFTENIVPSMQKFFDNHLGNELSTTSYIPNTTTNSYEGNLYQNKIGEPVTPPTGQIHNPRLLASEPPPQGNINRKSRLFRSLSQRIKRVSRTFVNTREGRTDESIIILNHNDKIQELLQKLEIQQTLIHQASKALNLCNVMKTFQHSTQHIESERLLLLSTLKKQAVLSEIKRINGPNDNVVELYEQGEVNISNIGLRLKEDVLSLISQTPDMFEWFIVTVTHESMVWATIAMNYSIDSPTTISFPDTITVSNLGPNFKILVNVYSLQLRSTSCNKKEGHSCNNNVSCPSPTNLWRRAERSRLRQNEIQCSSIRDTSFEPSGYAELTLQDIHEVSPWSLLSVPSNSILQGIIDLKFSCKIKITVVHAGFLTHGNEAGGFAAWNRRWCVLDGSLLKFWNYPQEQDLRPPSLIIDLTYCTSNEVQVVDRSLCAKPRTLMFKTTRERIPHDKNSMLLECESSYTVIRNLLSCDTITDLMEWRTKLNYVLSLLRNWNSRRNDLIPTTEL